MHKMDSMKCTYCRCTTKPSSQLSETLMSSSALLWLEDVLNTNTCLEIRMSKGTAFTGDQRQSKVIKGDQNHPALESLLVTGTALTTWGPGNVSSFSSQIHPITAKFHAHILCSCNWMHECMQLLTLKSPYTLSLLWPANYHKNKVLPNQFLLDRNLHKPYSSQADSAHRMLWRISSCPQHFSTVSTMAFYLRLSPLIFHSEYFLSSFYSQYHVFSVIVQSDSVSFSACALPHQHG